MMFALRYAVKSISRRKKKNAITTIAIALGVALVIGAQTGGDGVVTTIAKITLDGLGETDIDITNPASENGYFPQNATNLIEVSTDPRLGVNIEEIAPSVQLTTSVYSKGLIESDVTFYGIQPEDEGFGIFVDLDNNPIDISDLTMTLSGNNTIVSQALAEGLNLTIGETIVFSLGRGDGTFTELNLEVSKIFSQTQGRGKVGYVGPLDNGQFYVNLNTIQSQLIPELASSINKISLKIAGVDRRFANFDPFGQTFPGKDKIDDALEALQGVFLNGIDASNNIPLIFSIRVVLVETIETNLTDVTSIMSLFAFILNATALLLIVNVQIMAVEDKKNQTAIFRALGTSIGTIFLIFTIEATIVGIAGAFVGFALGYLVSLWMLGLLSDVFEVELEATSLDPGIIITAMIIGVVLSILTAVIPSINSARMNVSSALRGIDAEKKPRRGFLTLLVGFAFTALGLLSATTIGEFWKKETWESFENQASILLGLGLTLAGIGMLLTLVLSRRLALSISGLSFWGIANFVLLVGGGWAKTGDGSNWFVIIIFFSVIGSTMLIAINYDMLMNALTKFLFLFVGLGAIGQVTTRQMIGTKSRGILVVTILTLILLMAIFLVSLAETTRTGSVDALNGQSKDVDIVVSVNAPIPRIDDRLQGITASQLSSLGFEDVGEVEQVFGFRRVFVPMYLRSPLNKDFDVARDLTFIPLIEVPETVINPTKATDNWGDQSLALEFSLVSSAIEEDTGKPTVKSSREEHEIFTNDIFEKFFNPSESTRENEVEINQVKITESQTMTIGGSSVVFAFTDLELNGLDEFDFYISDKTGIPMPMYFGATTNFDMMGVAELLGFGILVTETVANQIPQFEDLASPNLFLVRTTNGWGSAENEAMADAIEIDLNDLGNDNSFSSEEGTLIGASTLIVYDEVISFASQQAGFIDFLAAFATLGLVIGGLGMMIISVRSVNERTREIGMMRSIGFSRQSVVVGVVIELLALSIIGLIVGLASGIIFTEGLASNFFGIPPVYPIFTIFLYVVGVISIALISGIIPGYNASKVTPSQALRYTG